MDAASIVHVTRCSILVLFKSSACTTRPLQKLHTLPPPHPFLFLCVSYSIMYTMNFYHSRTVEHDELYWHEKGNNRDIVAI